MDRVEEWVGEWVGGWVGGWVGYLMEDDFSPVGQDLRSFNEEMGVSPSSSSSSSSSSFSSPSW